MNTLFFKYAVEIEQTRSITRAAENLFMAQPNLSKAIKELEHEIGFIIFERNTKGVRPTRKGAEFLVYAQKILKEIEHISGLTGDKNLEYQTFSISVARASYIAEGFTRFAGELDLDKQINITMQETNAMQTVNNVALNRFNLGIIRYQTVYENYYLDFLTGKDLNYEQIWEFEYVILMSKNHPLAQMEKVQISDLEPFIEIIYGDTVIPYLSVAKLRYPSPKVVPQKRIYLYERCNQFDLLAGLHQTYMWVSPIPDRLLRSYDLVQRKCNFTTNKYKDMLIYPKGYIFTSLDKKFIDRVFDARNDVSLKQYT